MSEEVKYTNTNLGIEEGMKMSARIALGRLAEQCAVPQEIVEALIGEFEHVALEAFMNGIANGFLSGVTSHPGEYDYELIKRRIESMNPAVLKSEKWVTATSAASSDMYDRGLIDGWNAATKGDPTDPKYVQAKAIVQALATPTITS